MRNIGWASHNANSQMMTNLMILHHSHCVHFSTEYYILCLNEVLQMSSAFISVLKFSQFYYEFP